MAATVNHKLVGACREHAPERPPGRVEEQANRLRSAVSRAARAGLGLALLAQSALAVQDPTRPPAGLVTPPPGMSQDEGAPLVVSGVFVVGKQTFAIVGEREVRVGDRLGDVGVTRIDETGVWLRTSSGPRLLRLLPEIKKLPARP